MLLLIALTALAQPASANLNTHVTEDRWSLVLLETPAGQYNAGITLFVTVQNYTGAARWFKKAALRGHAKAQAILGSLHALGLGVPEDRIRAYAWLSLALPRLKGDALDQAAKQYEELNRLLTVEQISNARQLAETLRHH